MELRTLEYFLAVTRAKNITRAADQLHISQPYLSKTLMNLEAELGKQLLIRGKRQISLTEDGMLLRERAEEILSLVEKTEANLTSGQELEGEVAIGGNQVMTVLQAAASLRKHYPKVRFDFYSSDAQDIADRLTQGSLDFAVFLEPVDVAQYDYVSLPDHSEWGLLMPADSPLAKKAFVEKRDLDQVPLILHKRAGLQQLISHWAGINLDLLTIAATYNVINGSPTPLVKSGLGYYLTARDLMPAVLEKEVCFHPLNPPLETHYALVWKRSALLSKAARAFLAQVKAAVN